jgi:hypothetical protein
MTMSAAFALRTTPEIKAAAKSLVALWPHVTLRHNEKGLGLGSINEALNTLAVMGMAEIVTVLDEKIDELKPQLDCVQDMARFLMDNPAAQRVEEFNFPPLSPENQVLATLSDINTNLDDDGDWGGDYPTDMSEALQNLVGELLGINNYLKDPVTRGPLNSTMARLQEGLSACVEAKGALQRCLR